MQKSRAFLIIGTIVVCAALLISIVPKNKDYSTPASNGTIDQTEGKDNSILQENNDVEEDSEVSSMSVYPAEKVAFEEPEDQSVESLSFSSISEDKKEISYAEDSLPTENDVKDSWQMMDIVNENEHGYYGENGEYICFTYGANKQLRSTYIDMQGSNTSVFGVHSDTNSGDAEKILAENGWNRADVPVGYQIYQKDGYELELGTENGTVTWIKYTDLSVPAMEPQVPDEQNIEPEEEAMLSFSGGEDAKSAEGTEG